MYIIATVVVKISKKKTKRLTVGKKSVRNLIYLVSSWIFSHISFDFEAYVVVSFGLNKEMYLLATKIPPRCPPCCLLWFSREQNARVQLTFSLNEMYGYSRLCDRLRSSAIIWKQLSLRSSAIRGRLRSYGNQPLENYVIEMHPKSFGTFEKWGPKSRSRWHVIHGVEIEFPKLFAGSSLPRGKYFTRGLRA